MKITILGLGLIGGSLGLALKKISKSQNLRIVGVSPRAKTIEEAIGKGAIDEGTTDPIKTVREADLVFICTPINLILPMLKQISPHLKKGAIVTDVGSTKYEIVKEAEKIMPKGTFFVGGHPLAGKEKVKLESAEADLFKEKTWILTPTAKTSQRALEQVRELLLSLGAKTLEMDPKIHDQIVAAVSHLPLAVAVALVNTLAGMTKEREVILSCIASGFKDTTRIASGDPLLGVDIFTTNQKPILKMIKNFQKSLAHLKKLIKEGNPNNIKEELKKAKDFRDTLIS